jgi:threonine dehydratase
VSVDKSLPDIEDVKQAAARIAPFVHNTPLLSSTLLDQWSGHRIFFKAECLQKIGAFKARGALNTIMWLQEHGVQPRHIVANSSGNHAQAVAWAAQLCKIPATLFMPANVSPLKAQATAARGAEIVICPDRAAADEQAEAAAGTRGSFWVPPYNHPQVIAGQGTATYESLQELGHIDAVFAPCGGGGLLSGTLLAARSLIPDAEVIGVEPLKANDAAESLRAGSVRTIQGAMDTIADGARTPSVGHLTFQFLQQLDGFYEADEPQILYWTQWLQHLLKLHIEPTSAMTMEGAVQWLSEQTSPQTILVILSGGNIDQNMMKKIWSENYLEKPPVSHP